MQEGWDWPHLRLGEAELRGQLGPLGQRQVLRVLETLVQVLQLQIRVDGPRLAELLGRGLRAPLRGLQGQQRLLRVWGAAGDGVCTARRAGGRAVSWLICISFAFQPRISKNQAWGSALLYLPLHSAFKPLAHGVPGGTSRSSCPQGAPTLSSPVTPGEQRQGPERR